MDDTFVLLGAWRRTDRMLPVEERLAETYAHSGISVTLTSLTNCIAFFICTQTPFRALNYFSVFAAASLAASFVFQTTMFGGLLAYSGRAEEQGLHAVTCKPALPRSRAATILTPCMLAEDRGFWYQRCCTGGRDPDDPDNPLDNYDHPLMVWFRDRVGSFLIRKPVKVIVLILFLLYLSFAIWGALRLKEGLEVEDLFRHDSYAYHFAKSYQRYFTQYMVRIQVVIRESLDYFDPLIQSKIANLTSDFEKSPFISNYTHSWMKAFVAFSNQIVFSLLRYDFHNKEDFFHLLRAYFLKFPLTSDFIKDINFNKNKTEIVASRFFLLSSVVRDSTESKRLLLYLRDIVDKSSLPVTVFSPNFMAFEQMVVIKDCTIQSVATSAFVMMVVTFFFFPDIMCSLLVAFCMISVEVGVLGYMVWWGVTLNTASMIGLIMCVGFAVDNTAHMTYAYMTSKHIDDPDKKVLDALYSMGMPILQATGSTFIGLFAFCLVPSHQYITLFKTFFLVIVFSGIHSAIILPVLLSTFDYIFKKSKKRLHSEDEAMAFTIQEFSHLKQNANGSIPHSNGNGVSCHNRRFDDAIS
ncbi:daf-6 [Cordylochernes scorpioides]|uniref:Daf-6 n=1 Tax=Cordylochernes scorpioides TaxID=51811 RepID=A0ABY6KPV7_9ARAC|nr:daf-6 [Cordylochernes scorpioides]